MYNAELNYKGVKVNGFGIPTFLLFNKKIYNNNIHRLENKGYVVKNKDGWKITEAGKEKVRERAGALQSFASPFSNGDKRNLLLIFDIPEGEKVKREWLRMHLKEFNYKMIQRSVWVGPSPLPKEFVRYLKEIKLERCIKTYKLAKSRSGG